MTEKAVTIRGIPEEVHRAIRVRAEKHGHSLQAEMREILTNAVKSKDRVKLGDLLADIGKEVKLSNEEMVVFERNKSPASSVNFD